MVTPEWCDAVLQKRGEVSREELKADMRQRQRRHALIVAFSLAGVIDVVLIGLAIWYAAKGYPALGILCLPLCVLWTYTVRMFYKEGGWDN